LNFKISIYLFFFTLFSCGVKSDPVPEGKMLPTLENVYKKKLKKKVIKK